MQHAAIIPKRWKACNKVIRSGISYLGKCVGRANKSHSTKAAIVGKVHNGRRSTDTDRRIRRETFEIQFRKKNVQCEKALSLYTYIEHFPPLVDVAVSQAVHAQNAGVVNANVQSAVSASDQPE